jgi:hypothetical protein
MQVCGEYDELFVPSGHVVTFHFAPLKVAPERSAPVRFVLGKSAKSKLAP